MLEGFAHVFCSLYNVLHGILLTCYYYPNFSNAGFQCNDVSCEFKFMIILCTSFWVCVKLCCNQSRSLHTWVFAGCCLHYVRYA